MRSQTEYIITKAEVHAYAEDWLGTALRLEYQGYKCSTSTLLQVLLIAAARVVSLFAACRDLEEIHNEITDNIEDWVATDAIAFPWTLDSDSEVQSPRE